MTTQELRKLIDERLDADRARSRAERRCDELDAKIAKALMEPLEVVGGRPCAVPYPASVPVFSCDLSAGHQQAHQHTTGRTTVVWCGKMVTGTDDLHVCGYSPGHNGPHLDPRHRDQPWE